MVGHHSRQLTNHNTAAKPPRHPTGQERDKQTQTDKTRRHSTHTSTHLAAGSAPSAPRPDDVGSCCAPNDHVYRAPFATIKNRNDGSQGGREGRTGGRTGSRKVRTGTLLTSTTTCKEKEKEFNRENKPMHAGRGYYMRVHRSRFRIAGCLRKPDAPPLSLLGCSPSLRLRALIHSLLDCFSEW